ncbi:MAG: Malonyl CoA-acyl carrier protein transacylase, partial [Cyanobacteria bacterium RYN_339]|nr:Malonyl CoA-acyl carrier protein transacylase [Cyanobacteria bacterium RYN_339]
MIAVVGLGCRFPGAASPEAYWKLLAEGIDAVGPAPAGRGLDEHGGFLPDVASFAPRRFGLSAAEAAMMDPQQRLALEVAMDALDDAAIAPESLAGSATGVYMGVSSADYAQLTLRDAARVDAYTNAGAAASVIANRLSYLLDLRGPSLVLDTACSSSLVAVHQACRDLRDGVTDVAIAGGVNVILSSAVAAGFHAAKATSPDARCMAFDARANGMVRGEGCGVVVLKRLDDARRDGDLVHAVIRGGAVNQDGRTNGLTAPNRQGQEALLRQAYRHAGVNPSSVTVVETHGTGTPLGDPIEAAALAAVLAPGRTSPLVLGAVKTNLGHLEAAAGIAGLIKAVLALRHQAWPPNLHYTAPNPHIDLTGLAIPTTLTPLPSDPIIGVSAFGFGGTNAHLVLAAGTQAPESTGLPPHVLFLSAKSPDLLPAYAAAIAPAGLAGLCHTAAHRRHHHRSRVALVFSTSDELQGQLSALPDPFRAPVRPPKLAFILPGMGSQQPGMGKALLAEPAFRAAIEACDVAMRPHLGWSLLAELEAADPERQARGDVAQPLVFGLQVGLAALWASWGVRPDAVIGASLGEIAAAYLAGALTLDEAARVVCVRARVMMERAGEGGMAVAGVNPAEAEALLAAQPGRAWVAAHNAPDQVLVAGELPALEALIVALEGQERFGRIVRGAQVASHSPMVEPLRAPLQAALGRVEARPAVLPMVSTVEARRLGDDLLDETYWWRNMREPVRFAPAIAALEAEGPHVYLELSAHPSMTTAIAACGPAQVAGSLRRGRPERLAVREALATLYGWGVALDFDAIVPRAVPVPLPPIPWPRERCWVGEQAVAEAVVPQAGTLDRGALLALPPAERRDALVTALRSHVARILVLSPALVDVDEPLTSLGVGSLMGMELNNRLERELGVRLPVARLLAGPSVAQIADEALIQLAGGDAESVIPVGPATPTAPMSPAQRRLYFLARLAPDAAAYNIPAAVALEGALDAGALARALDAVVARHAALRTTFVPDEAGEAVQAIAPALVLDLPVIDLRDVPVAEREAEARAIAADEARQPFDLATGPLLRALVLRLDGQRHWLLVTLHHLVADGWSLGLLLRELAAAYQSALAGRPPALPPLTVQYADYARWQLARGDQDQHLAFWREHLAGAPPLLALPTDRPRPAVQRFHGAVAGKILAPELVQAVEALARREQATPFMVLYAAFAAWLARAAGQTDLVVGTPIAGRDHPGLEPLIGFFLNTLPLRLSLADDPAFTALVARARATVIAAFEHQDVPFERLVESLPLERGGGHAPVFQVMLALHAPVRGVRVGDLALQPLEIDHGTAKYDLTAAFLETDAGLRCAFEYDADLFDAATVEAWLGQFQALLASAVASPDTTVARLRLLDAPKEAAVLALGRGPALAPSPGPWWGPIAARAATHPGDPAVQDPHETLTYAELDARARALAATLPTGGGPVAVLLPRSVSMVVAWLAAAYAGAPYLPLDPDAPAARLEQILADAKPAVVLRDASVAPPAAFTPIPGDLAYLIYTSGTTGRPKGVVIPDAGLSALIAWHCQAYCPGPGTRMAQVANPGFDAAAWEVWPALAAGATVVIAPDDARSP